MLHEYHPSGAIIDCMLHLGACIGLERTMAHPVIVAQIVWQSVVCCAIFGGGGVFMMVCAKKIAIGNNNITRWMTGFGLRTESDPSILDRLESWFVFFLGFMLLLWGIAFLFI